MAASRAVLLGSFTEDVAAGRLAQATARGPQITAALTAFAVAAAAAETKLRRPEPPDPQ
jgi:hypothetical protein